MNNDFVFACLLNQAGVDELRHQVVRHLAVLAFLLEQLHLLLELLELRQLRLGLGPLLFLGEFLLTDLFECAAAFAGHLKHVGGDAFAHYTRKVVKEVEVV